MDELHQWQTDSKINLTTKPHHCSSYQEPRERDSTWKTKDSSCIIALFAACKFPGSSNNYYVIRPTCEALTSGLVTSILT